MKTLVNILTRKKGEVLKKYPPISRNKYKALNKPGRKSKRVLFIVNGIKIFLTIPEYSKMTKINMTTITSRIKRMKNIPAEERNYKKIFKEGYAKRGPKK